MRIACVGAGAVGGHMSGRLALAGNAVTIIGRGRSLAAIQRRGLRLIEPGGEEHVVEVEATGDWSAPGPQEVVILAVKAHDVATVAPRIPELMQRDTTVVTIQNGIPWWYFHGFGGALNGRQLRSLDPEGTIGSNIDASRIVGCIVYPALTQPEPGAIRRISGHRYPLGEPDGTRSERVTALVEAFNEAQLRSRVLEDIRSEIWLKALGSLSFNPISALTRATLEEICAFEGTRTLAALMMEEAQEIGRKLGVAFRHTIDERIAGAARVGAHKTSMLQDVERGRPLEIEALVGAVVEMGRLTRTPTPAIDAVYALTAQLDRSLQSDPAAGHD